MMMTATSEPFVPQQCLFCDTESENFESNLQHMQKAHGLFIPDRKRLIVEVETLVAYLHLVIFSYHECISCGTQRNSLNAVQQHMKGKGHCRFDIADESSEYADFYDFSESGSESEEQSDGSDGDEEDHTHGPKSSVDYPLQPDGDSLRLPSGKIVSKSSASQQPRPRRQREGSPQSQIQDGSADGGSSGTPNAGTSTALIPTAQQQRGKRGIALTRSEKKEATFSNQLARLSASDRASLIHLPASEQRAILATQQKQADKARKAERRYQSRVDRLGNRTLMKHFVPDTPGRSNG
ncbi:C2H2 type zinc-finger-domain-containing protein [Xylariales sp. PMI_506]|nr:C2H2 type zinc-finger-domain-containing protein [Xylariales sp. PMI_506]